MKIKKKILSLSRVKSMLAMMPLAMIIVTLTVGCSDDNDGPDTSSMFVGDFEVEDISQSSGYVYNYTVSVSKAGANQIQISNFADLFNVPIKANVSGMNFTIPKQSFTNPSGKSISVSGSGSLTGDVLTFQYTTTGYLDYAGDCEAVRYP